MQATDALFYAIHIPVLPLWAAWIAAPRSRLAHHFATALWPWAVLASMYVLLIGSSMFVFPSSPQASMGSLSGVQAIFGSPWATLGCWMHYLCFDAFVGRWIVNDAPQAGYRLSPVLALVLFFGPAGLLLYLALRGRLRGVRSRTAA